MDASQLYESLKKIREPKGYYFNEDKENKKKKEEDANEGGEEGDDDDDLTDPDDIAPWTEGPMLLVDEIDALVFSNTALHVSQDVDAMQVGHP